MRADLIVVNTLVFEYLLNKGERQHDLFGGLREIGVRNVEVRREYVKSKIEFEKMGQTAREYGLGIFYSVPDCLFSNGVLQSEKLGKYLKEANQMNARMVKFTKGGFKGWHDQDITQFKAVAKEFGGVITVENDQTELDGIMKALIPFYQESKEKGVPVYATFDIGNGHWVGENPLESVREIKDFTSFVHLKDVKLEDGGPRAAYLGEGVIPWEKILTEFDSHIYAAIEYPCGEKPFERLRDELAKLN